MLFSLFCKATGGKPLVSRRLESFSSPKAEPPSDIKEISCLPTQKQSPAIGLNVRSMEKAPDKAFVVPSIVCRGSPDGRDGTISGKDAITFSRTKRGMLLKPAHARRPSNSKVELDGLPEAVETRSLSNVASNLDGPIKSNIQSKFASVEGCRESSDEKDSNIEGVAEKFENFLSPQTPSSQESGKFLWYSTIRIPLNSIFFSLIIHFHLFPLPHLSLLSTKFPLNAFC